MKRAAVTAVGAQGVQAGVSFILQALVAHLLGIEEYGRFAVLYGVLVVATGIVSGLVGDTLVALHRDERAIRAALVGTLVVSAAGSAVVAATVFAAVGFVSIVEAAAYAAAVAMFVVEEVFRRLLGADFAFVRMATIDSIGFVVTLAVIGVSALSGELSLLSFMLALAIGQAVASIAGVLLVPARERWLPSPLRGDYATVLRYGSWRALVQTLRPGMFTVTRLLVLAFSGLVAVGLLEAARTYTSPLLLVVGGLSSFLFARFAHRTKAGEGISVRESDRVSGLLLVATILMGAVAVALASWLGPLLFGVRLDVVSVIAWAVYGASVAVVTPYGALSAVTGRQTAVFFIRLSDTLLGLLIATVMLVAGLGAPFVPFGLAVASLLGGLGLRWLARRQTPPPPGPRRSGNRESE